MAKVLLVTRVAADEHDLSQELWRAIGDDSATVRVVAPATDVSRLDWLTNDENDAREEACDAAQTAARAVESTSVEIDATSHDTDAAQAVVDALRGFDAEEIVVVTRPGDDANWLEEDALGSALESSRVQCGDSSSPRGTGKGRLRRSRARGRAR